jgi:hypothetical protein
MEEGRLGGVSALVGWGVRVALSDGDRQAITKAQATRYLGGRVVPDRSTSRRRLPRVWHLRPSARRWLPGKGKAARRPAPGPGCPSSQRGGPGDVPRVESDDVESDDVEPDPHLQRQELRAAGRNRPRTRQGSATAASRSVGRVNWPANRISDSELRPRWSWSSGTAAVAHCQPSGTGSAPAVPPPSWAPPAPRGCGHR